jgi:hypothetical protein
MRALNSASFYVLAAVSHEGCSQQMHNFCTDFDSIKFSSVLKASSEIISVSMSSKTSSIIHIF